VSFVLAERKLAVVFVISGIADPNNSNFPTMDLDCEKCHAVSKGTRIISKYDPASRTKILRLRPFRLTSGGVEDGSSVARPRLIIT